jgi:hypothetical protein
MLTVGDEKDVVSTHEDLLPVHVGGRLRDDDGAQLRAVEEPFEELDPKESTDGGLPDAVPPQQ